MLHYQSKLKSNARLLRKNATDAERLLWSRLRRKQLGKVSFYRQKPMGNYIVDFYAPSLKLVIEVDGSQHEEASHLERDKQRDYYLGTLGLKVLRFNNLEVLQSLHAVLEVIFDEIRKCVEIPPTPLYKGGNPREIDDCRTNNELVSCEKDSSILITHENIGR